MGEQFEFDRAAELLASQDPKIDGRRILYVDDEPLLRSATVNLLQREGAVCLAAGTHDEAIVLLSQEPLLDLVILDFNMPDGDVSSLIRRVRSQRPSLQLIGTSGEDCRDEFAARGVDDFLPKPWDLAELLRIADWAEAP